MQIKITCMGTIIGIKYNVESTNSFDLCFTAPKVITRSMDKKYGKEVDVFSFGCIISIS